MRIRFLRNTPWPVKIAWITTCANAIFIVAASLAAYSSEPQSLSDYIAVICSRALRTSPAAEASYMAENVSAMTKMMVDVSIKPSGDVDKDFVAMMIPHHQAAVEMAQALLRHGNNESLRRLAQEIVVIQQQEIAAMRLALGAPASRFAAPGRTSDLAAQKTVDR